MTKELYKTPFLPRLGGLLFDSLNIILHETLDAQVVGYDARFDLSVSSELGPYIYLLWHEYIAAPIGLWPHSPAAILTSAHKDASFLRRVAMHRGYSVVCGSTKRGGDKAIRKLKEQAKDHHLVITPDGPRGPRRKMAPGAVYLASRLGIPLVPLGFGYSHVWRAPTWDRFAVPKPFSRARIVGGPLLHIPPGIDKAGVEHYRQKTEDILNLLTNEAEEWAVAGDRRQGQRPMFPLRAVKTLQELRQAQEAAARAGSVHPADLRGQEIRRAA